MVSDLHVVEENNGFLRLTNEEHTIASWQGGGGGGLKQLLNCMLHHRAFHYGYLICNHHFNSCLVNLDFWLILMKR